MTIPLIVLDADPGNASFQLILVVSAPLDTTVPLPMNEALTEPREASVNTDTADAVRRERSFICVCV